MRAKFIYEKFKEESDPIKDLGIGKVQFFKAVIDEQFNGSKYWKEIYNEYYKKQYCDNEEYQGHYHDLMLIIILSMLRELINNFNQDEQLLFNNVCNRVFKGKGLYTDYWNLLYWIKRDAARILKQKFFINVKPYTKKKK